MLIVVVVVLICSGLVYDFDFIFRKYLIIDRSWMKVNRLIDMYKIRVRQFLKFVERNLPYDK